MIVKVKNPDAYSLKKYLYGVKSTTNNEEQSQVSEYNGLNDIQYIERMCENNENSLTFLGDKYFAISLEKKSNDEESEASE